MRITTVAFSVLAGLFLAIVPQLRAADEDGAVSKTGRLVVVADEAGAITSARLVCPAAEGAEVGVSYALVLNEKTQAAVAELKGKDVVVTGTLKKGEGDAGESMVVVTIVAAEEKAAVPAAEKKANE